MLKRNQVLLNDWMVDFLKFMSDKYDFSFSETIRLALCLYYGTMTVKQYPEYNFNITLEEIVDLMDNYESTIEGEEERHKTASRVYFETRKAIEFYMEKEKEKGNNR